MSTGADVLAAQALGADLAYLGTRFIATTEANASEEYKQMLVDSRAEDIVYTSLFSGVSGNYLRGSVASAGLDPDNLPEADKTKMNFGSGGNTELKAWRDIWSAGQSVERHPRRARPVAGAGGSDGARIRGGAARADGRRSCG